jgi:hypothetical protein
VKKASATEKTMLRCRTSVCSNQTCLVGRQAKQNFKRFNLRSKKKIEIETGLLAIAHNLKKMVA